MVVSTWTPVAWELSRQLAISLGQIRDDGRVAVHIVGAVSPTKEQRIVKIAKSGGDNRVIDPGMYRVRCVGAAGEDKPDDAYGKTKKVRVMFKTVEVMDAEGQPVELERVVNLAFNAKSNLYAIFQALGLPVEDELYEPDTDDLLGKEANAIVTDYTAEGDGSQWSRVERLMALPKGAAKAAVARPAARTTAPEDLPWEDAEADANALESFYEAGDQYARRSEIKSTSQRMFDNRLPEALTTQEREELLSELKRGAS